MADKLKVIHDRHIHPMKYYREHKNHIYVGLLSLDYGPIVDFRAKAEFLKDFEPEWIENLKGKTLVCDCSNEKECHAHILLELANPAEQLELF